MFEQTDELPRVRPNAILGMQISYLLRFCHVEPDTTIDVAPFHVLIERGRHRKSEETRAYYTIMLIGIGQSCDPLGALCAASIGASRDCTDP